MKQRSQILIMLGLLWLIWRFTESHIGRADTHFILDIVSAFAALLVSIVAFNLSTTPRNRLMPYIGVAYLSAALFSLIDAFKSAGIILSKSIEPVFEYCWLDFYAAAFFSVIILTGVILIYRNPRHDPGVLRILAYVVPVAILVTGFTALLDFPEFESSSFPWLHKFLVSVPMAICVAIIFVTLKSRSQKNTDRETSTIKALFPMLVIAIWGQILMQVSEFSSSNFVFDVGHFFMVASFLLALLPLIKTLSHQSKYSFEVAGARIMTFNVALLLVLLLIPIMGFVNYEKNMKNDNLSNVLLANNTIHQARSLQNNLKNYLLSGDKQYQQQFENSWLLYRGLKSNFAEHYDDKDQLEIEDQYTEIRKLASIIFANGGVKKRHQALVVVEQLDGIVHLLLEHLYAKMDGFNKTMIVDKMLAERQLHSNLFLQVMAIISLLPVMIGINIWHNRRQIAPVLELTDTARRIVAGEQDVRIVSEGKDEIGVLGRSFSALLDQLRKAVNGLEERVEERTKELSRSEQQVRNIMDNASEGIITTGGWGIINTVNPATCKIFGYESQELVGTPFYNLIHEDNIEETIFGITQSRDSHDRSSRQQSCRRVSGLRKDGSIFSLEINIAKVTGEQETTFVFVLRDITSMLKAENALRDSEQRMSRFFDASLEGLLFHNKGVITDTNNAVLELMGVKAIDIIGKDLVDIVISEHRADFQGKINSHAPYLWETIAISRDGKQIPIEIQMRDIAFGDNISSIVVVRDIRERKKAARALKKQSQFTQRILDTISSLVFVVNADGCIIGFNNACQQTTGYSIGDVKNKHIWDVMIDLDDNSDIQQVYKYPVESDFPNHRQYQWLTKDGDIKVIDWVNTAVIAEDGSIEYVIATGVDITDRLKVEKELSYERRNLERNVKERTRELDAIFTLSPDGFVMINKNNKVVFANPAFQHMSGMVSIEIFGLDEKDFYQQLFSLCDSNMDKVGFDINSGTDTMMLHLVHPEDRYLSFTTRTFWDENNVSGGQVLYFRDVTHETEVDRMKSEFLSTAAHEFRTPLSSIMGFSELLLSPGFSEEKRNEVTEIIYRQSIHLKSLLDELLDLTRIDARAGKDFRTVVDTPEKLLKQVFEDTISLRKDEHTLRLDLPDSWPLLAYDQEKFRQVLNNVISNAYKYSPDGGLVICSTLTRERNLKQEFGIQIQDQGIGLTPEELQRVGERFYRADNSGKIPGTGLGMSLVKETMEIFEGELEVNSEKGKGTTVTLWLPIVEDAATAKVI